MRRVAGGVPAVTAETAHPIFPLCMQIGKKGEHVTAVSAGTLQPQTDTEWNL